MKVRVLLAVMCAALLVVPAAFADTTTTMSIAGDVETNTDVQFKDYGEVNSVEWGNGGRTHIAFTGMLEGDNGWFASAKGDAMIDVTGTTGVDDAWVKFGTPGFAVLVGRYEAPGSFNKGQDTFIASAPGSPRRYQVDFARGRLPVNNIALIFGSFELGVIAGGLTPGTYYTVTTDPQTGITTSEVIDLDFGVNAYGARPVYVYSGDAFTLKAAAEYITYMPQVDKIAIEEEGPAGEPIEIIIDNDAAINRYGAGIVLEGNFGNSTAGISLAYAQENATTVRGDDSADANTLSTFAYWTMGIGEANSLGLGIGYTGLDIDQVTSDTMFEGFISFNQQLPVEGLWIKYAGSYAGATIDPESADSLDTSSFGIRVRLNYDF